MCCCFKIGWNLNSWPVWIGCRTQWRQKASRVRNIKLASTRVQNVQIQGENMEQEDVNAAAENSLYDAIYSLMLEHVLGHFWSFKHAYMTIFCSFNFTVLCKSSCDSNYHFFGSSFDIEEKRWPWKNMHDLYIDICYTISSQIPEPCQIIKLRAAAGGKTLPTKSPQNWYDPVQAESLSPWTLQAVGCVCKGPAVVSTDNMFYWLVARKCVCIVLALFQFPLYMLCFNLYKLWVVVAMFHLSKLHLNYIF